MELPTNKVAQKAQANNWKGEMSDENVNDHRNEKRNEVKPFYPLAIPKEKIDRVY